MACCEEGGRSRGRISAPARAGSPAHSLADHPVPPAHVCHPSHPNSLNMFRLAARTLVQRAPAAAPRVAFTAPRANPLRLYSASGKLTAFPVGLEPGWLAFRLDTDR